MTTIRVAVLWKRPSGYLAASLRALGETGASVSLMYEEAGSQAPYDESVFDSTIDSTSWRGRPGRARVQSWVEDRDPHVVLVCSWDVADYRRAARRLTPGSVRVLCMDNQWRSTLRQWAGVVLFRSWWHRSYDRAFVSGDRQARFARRLGFKSHDVSWGLYSADTPTFAACAGGQRRAGFMFAGRLVREKGISILADAYRQYRETEADPWPLIVVGTGPLRPLLESVEGVQLQGFIQPSSLPQLFASVSCFVLPSLFEPWGVVIHEAAASGLPVIASDACGAVERLVLPGHSGFVVPTGDSDALASALRRVARAPDSERAAMGAVGRSLAWQFTPETWAKQVLAMAPAELR